MFTPYTKSSFTRYRNNQDYSQSWYYGDSRAYTYPEAHMVPYLQQQGLLSQQRATYQSPRATANHRQYGARCYEAKNQSPNPSNPRTLAMIRPSSGCILGYGSDGSMGYPQAVRDRPQIVLGTYTPYRPCGSPYDDSSVNARTGNRPQSMTQYDNLNGAGQSRYSDSFTNEHSQIRPLSMLQYYSSNGAGKSRYNETLTNERSRNWPQSVSQYEVSRNTSEPRYDDSGSPERGRSRDRTHLILLDNDVGVRHKRDCSQDRWKEYIKQRRKSQSLTESTLATLGNLKDNARIMTLSRSLLRSLGQSVSSYKAHLLAAWLQDTRSSEDHPDDSRAVVKAGDPHRVGWADPLIKPPQNKDVPPRSNCMPPKSILKNMKFILQRRRISPRALPCGERYTIKTDGDIVLYRYCRLEELDHLTEKTAVLRNGYHSTEGFR